MSKIYMIVNKETKKVESYFHSKHHATLECAQLNRTHAHRCMKMALDIKAPKRRGAMALRQLVDKMADGNFRIAEEIVQR